MPRNIHTANSVNPPPTKEDSHSIKMLCQPLFQAEDTNFDNHQNVSFRSEAKPIRAEKHRENTKENIIKNIIVPSRIHINFSL